MMCPLKYQKSKEIDVACNSRCAWFVRDSVNGCGACAIAMLAANNAGGRSKGFIPKSKPI